MIDRRPLQGQQDSLPIHQNRRISSDTDVTALANRTTNWGACWRFCGSGLPRTWYILIANYLFREIVLLRLEQKYIKGKPCKPYNSTLGEFFRVSSQIPFYFFIFFYYAHVAKFIFSFRISSVIGRSKTPLLKYPSHPVRTIQVATRLLVMLAESRSRYAT